MTDLNGQTLGRYRILHLLGTGGMATVYKALDVNLEREMAIKFIRSDSFPPTRLNEILKRFEREAKALARLSHSHIVKVYDYGDFQGIPFLVMEYQPGGTLKDRLGVPLPYVEAVEQLLPIARALQYAHRHGVLHRDVKPANILINAEGEPVLSDFGIAKLLEGDDGTTLTGTGIGIGTPEYMAPEQGLGLEMDARADVYALGVVLYELITGQKPFTADTPMQVVFKHVHEPLPDPRLIVPDLPQVVVDILNKAMAKNVQDRYADASQFITVLETLIHPSLVKIPSAEAQEDQATTIVPVVDSQPETEVSTLISDEVIAPVFPLESGEDKSAPQRPVLWKFALPGGLMIAAALIVAALLLGGDRSESPVGGVSQMTATSQTAAQSDRPAPTKMKEVQPPPPEPTPEKPAEPAFEPPAGEPIKVAVLVPLSGSAPSFGISARNGALLAIQEWNGRGGVLGRPIEPILEDTQCMGDPAIELAHKVIDEDDVKFIIGEICSNASLPISEIADKRGVVQISPASTNSALTVHPNGTVKPYIFRACFVDPFQGQVMAKFARDRGFQTAFLMIDPENVYSLGLSENFESVFVDRGGEIVGKAMYTKDQDHFSGILTQVIESNADILFLPDYYSVINRVIVQAREKGVSAVFMGGDGWDSPELDKIAAEGAFYTAHFSSLTDRPIVRGWVEYYQAEFRMPPDGIAALSYDAANMLLAAIEQAGSDDPAVVKETLAVVEWDGVTGLIRFDRFHNPYKPAVIMQIHDRNTIFVDLVSP
jgi:branched-chain amino acid transport system substrate-binding protein